MWFVVVRFIKEQEDNGLLTVFLRVESPLEGIPIVGNIIYK